MNEFGPWHYSEVLGEVRSESDDVIAQLLVSGKEDEAGRLLAAAPELLDALQEMVAIVKKHTYPQPDKPSSTWDRMEAAESLIAKALGQ